MTFKLSIVLRSVISCVITEFSIYSSDIDESTNVIIHFFPCVGQCDYTFLSFCVIASDLCTVNLSIYSLFLNMQCIATVLESTVDQVCIMNLPNTRNSVEMTCS